METSAETSRGALAKADAGANKWCSAAAKSILPCCSRVRGRQLCVATTLLLFPLAVARLKARGLDVCSEMRSAPSFACFLLAGRLRPGGAALARTLQCTQGLGTNNANALCWRLGSSPALPSMPPGQRLPRHGSPRARMHVKLGSQDKAAVLADVQAIIAEQLGKKTEEVRLGGLGEGDGALTADCTLDPMPSPPPPLVPCCR